MKINTTKLNPQTSEYEKMANELLLLLSAQDDDNFSL